GFGGANPTKNQRQKTGDQRLLFLFSLPWVRFAAQFCGYEVKHERVLRYSSSAPSGHWQCRRGARHLLPLVAAPFLGKPAVSAASTNAAGVMERASVTGANGADGITSIWSGKAFGACPAFSRNLFRLWLLLTAADVFFPCFLNL